MSLGKHLLILEIFQETASEFVILKSNIESRFKKMLKILPSSSAYGEIYRITGCFLNAATSILKRVSVRIFKISNCFHRSKQKL
jgi:hypothetical protein